MHPRSMMLAHAEKVRKYILMLAYQTTARYWEPSVPSFRKKELEVHILMVSHA